MFTSTESAACSVDVKVPDYSGNEGLSDHNVTTPELRLWSAVICAIIFDYERILKKITSLRKPKFHLKHTLQGIRYEATSPFIAEMCDHLGVAHSRILSRLDALEAKYKLSQVVFEHS